MLLGQSTRPSVHLLWQVDLLHDVSYPPHGVRNILSCSELSKIQACLKLVQTVLLPFGPVANVCHHKLNFGYLDWLGHWAVSLHSQSFDEKNLRFGCRPGQ
jgi:hypothetical protein